MASDRILSGVDGAPMPLEQQYRTSQHEQQEQRHLGRLAIPNLPPDWGDDEYTTGAARIYTLNQHSIPRDALPVDTPEPAWTSFHS